MKRKLIALCIAVILCFALTVPAFAAGSSGTEPQLFNPTWLILCLLIGFLLAFIPMSILKGQINNVHGKTEAESYTRKDSFTLAVRQDNFLYKNVTAVPLPRNNNNGK